MSQCVRVVVDGHPEITQKLRTTLRVWFGYPLTVGPNDQSWFVVDDPDEFREQAEALLAVTSDPPPDDAVRFEVDDP